MSIFLVRSATGGISQLATKAQIGLIQLDASIDETHKFESLVPEYPVEDGTVISDTVINRPDALDIRGVVAATNADDAFKSLLTIRDSKQVITVITSAKVYSNMIMKSLTVPRNKSTGDSLIFTASFQEVKFADIITIDVVTAIPAAPKVVGGALPYEPPPPSLQNFFTELETNLYGSSYTGPGI